MDLHDLRFLTNDFKANLVSKQHQDSKLLKARVAHEKFL